MHSRQARRHGRGGLVRWSAVTLAAGLVLTGAAMPTMARSLTETEHLEPDQVAANVATGPVVGADDLGRVLPTAEDAPAQRQDRTVGMFYFSWHGSNEMREYGNVHDISAALADDPQAWQDPTNGAFPPPNHFAYWGQPAFGYYRSDDEWVVQRHLQLLADAGVDYLVIDATNQEVYKPVAQLLMEQIVQFQAEGIDAPQLVFMTRSGSTAHMDDLYRTFYAPDAPIRHPSTWFHWDGKPLIMGAEPSQTVSDFFTFRFTQWPNQEQQADGWDWISFDRPQRGNEDEDGSLEQMAVSTAQNSGNSTAFSNTAWYGVDDPPSRSRAFHDGAEPEDAEGAVLRGANFEEEWDYAIEQDPETIFVTGWNEWIAGNWAASANGPMLFYDVLDQRWNRDIEPMAGGSGDNYYMQLVDNIRRYKGVNPPDNVSEPTTIELDGSFEQWRDVSPEYIDHARDTVARNHPGVDGTLYTNDTGQNNILSAKVARDDDSVFFYVRTEDPLSEPGERWMHLYLDVTGDLTDNWSGYDARVVFDAHGTASLERYDGQQWQEETNLEATWTGNELALAVPRELLNAEEDHLTLAFKWWDNATEEITDAYTIGDAAPAGRFSYYYDTGEHAEGVAPQVPEAEALGLPRPGSYRIEDADPRSDYENSAGEIGWEEVADPDSSGGSYSVLSNPEGEQHHAFWRTFVRTGFRGEALTWIAPRGPEGTSAEVFVDGLSQGTVSLHAPEWEPAQELFRVQGLSDGYHEAMVVFDDEAGEYYHDAFEVGVGQRGMERPSSALAAGQMAWASGSGFTPVEFLPTNPAQATDGSMDTWWAGTSAEGDHLTLELGWRTPVRTVHIEPRPESDSTVTGYRIEERRPDGSWRPVVTEGDLDGPTTLDLGLIVTDAVRLVIESTEGGVPEIAELTLGDGTSVETQ